VECLRFEDLERPMGEAEQEEDTSNVCSVLELREGVRDTEVNRAGMERKREVLVEEVIEEVDNFNALGCFGEVVEDRVVSLNEVGIASLHNGWVNNTFLLAFTNATGVFPPPPAMTKAMGKRQKRDYTGNIIRY